MCETKLLQYNSKCVKCSGKYDLYDQTLPTNGFKFMAPVRRWEKRMGFLTPLRWNFIGLFGFFHTVALIWTTSNIYYGMLPKWQTVAFTYLMANVGLFGITAGVHRYWCHRSFKAKLPLRIILLLCYASTGHNTIKRWVHDHRVHHKFSDTDADPHNVCRGFFFSHIGWILMQRHPRYFEEASKIDMSDILNDKLVMFHTKYFLIIRVVVCFIIPTLLPAFFWNETWDQAILSQVFLRYVYLMNCLFSVNSFAHMYGTRPYDDKIFPTDNLIVAAFTMGGAWHNYHHSFPWDYRAAEIPRWFSGTTILLDFFAKIGWAYDLKTASPELVNSIRSKKNSDRKCR